jgi:hypothetical protein
LPEPTGAVGHNRVNAHIAEALSIGGAINCPDMNFLAEFFQFINKTQTKYCPVSTGQANGTGAENRIYYVSPGWPPAVIKQRVAVVAKPTRMPIREMLREFFDERGTE